MDSKLEEIPKNQINIYLQNAGAHKPGITRHQVNEYYNEWSSKYEQVSFLNIQVRTDNNLASIGS